MNRLFIGFTFILGIIFSALFALSAKLDGDMIQLWQFAKTYFETGELMPFGNMAASGVFIPTPGYFLPLATIIPLKVWFHPLSPMLFILFLHGVSLWLMLSGLKVFFDSSQSQFFQAFWVMFWLNPWRTKEVFLWNPAYVFFFTALHFWTFSRLQNLHTGNLRIACSSKSLSRFFDSLLHIIALGFVIQAHISGVILSFMTGWLVFQRRMRINLLGAGVGFILIGFSFFPFFQWYLEVGSQSYGLKGERGFLFRGVVLIYPLLKTIFYWIREGSFLFPSDIVFSVNFLRFGELEAPLRWLWLTLLNLVAVVTLIWNFFSHWVWIQRLKQYMKWPWKIWSDRVGNLDMYLVSAILALCVSGALIPYEVSYWHVLLLFPLAVIVPIREWSLRTEKKVWPFKIWIKLSQPKMLATGLVVFFIVVHLGAIQNSKKFSLPPTLEADFRVFFSPIVTQ